MRLCAIVAAILLVALPAFSADVDGKWSGTILTPGGEFPAGFTFKADGAALSGTTLGPDGGEVPIKDGKVDGDKISFNVTFDFGGQALVILYTGVVSAEQIQLTADVMGMPLQFAVKRAK